MADMKLASPAIRVVREDGETLTVQTTNADLVLWDRTRIKHKWPKFDEAPFLWLTFLSWAAARRTKAIPGDVSYEAWEATTLSVDADPEDELAGDIGAPTQPGPGPG